MRSRASGCTEDSGAARPAAKTDAAKALRGKAAVANARLAYAEYEQVFMSPRYEKLSLAGGRVQRPLWAHTRVWVFGHAALEKLVRPYKSITVHLWRVPEGVTDATLDAWLAEDLQPAKLALKPFSPLPILGVPGWWAANADPHFYDDPQVFRPARPRQAVVQKPCLASEIGASV